MARKVEVTLIDDIDGSKADSTVEFSIGGTTYEIDLSDANAERLENALTPFIEKARKVSNARRKQTRASRGAASSVSTTASPAAIREWAEAQGIKVSGRGRIPREVLDAYAQAH